MNCYLHGAIEESFRSAQSIHVNNFLLLASLQEAIEAFGRLSAGQYATGWVLSCVGRACFEAVDYPQVCLVL